MFWFLTSTLPCTDSFQLPFSELLFPFTNFLCSHLFSSDPPPPISPLQLPLLSFILFFFVTSLLFSTLQLDHRHHHPCKPFPTPLLPASMHLQFPHRCSYLALHLNSHTTTITTAATITTTLISTSPRSPLFHPQFQHHRHQHYCIHNFIISNFTKINREKTNRGWTLARKRGKHVS